MKFGNIQQEQDIWEIKPLKDVKRVEKKFNYTLPKSLSLSSSTMEDFDEEMKKRNDEDDGEEQLEFHSRNEGKEKKNKKQ